MAAYKNTVGPFAFTNQALWNNELIDMANSEKHMATNNLCWGSRILTTANLNALKAG